MGEMLVKAKLWWQGTKWAAASLAKVGEVLSVMEKIDDDTIDAVQGGWYQVMAVRAQIE